MKYLKHWSYQYNLVIIGIKRVQNLIYILICVFGLLYFFYLPAFYYFWITILIEPYNVEQNKKRTINLKIEKYFILWVNIIYNRL